MPGSEYAGTDPDAFISRAGIVSLLENNESSFQLPVQHNTIAEEVIPLPAGGYRVVTNQGDWSARNVIIATGLFQKPKRSAIRAMLSPQLHQLHCSDYRNPSSLPDGGVLIVGSAQSGCQIAEELLESGRQVWLSVGTAGRVPRRYRGKDITVWLNMLGFFDRTPDALASPRQRFAANPQLSGTRGGPSLNLHLFARSDMHLVGHVIFGEDHRVQLANDLEQSLSATDAIEDRFARSIDAFIAANGITAPEETLEHYRDGFAQSGLTQLDLKARDVKTIIWANGFDFDYSLVKLPATDNDGFPMTQGGVSAFPGLSFIGMPFLSKMKSGLFLGVGEDAQRIAAHIAGRPVVVKSSES